MTPSTFVIIYLIRVILLGKPSMLFGSHRVTGLNIPQVMVPSLYTHSAYGGGSVLAPNEYSDEEILAARQTLLVSRFVLLLPESVSVSLRFVLR